MKYKLFKKFIERILEHMEISHGDLFDKSKKKSVVMARQLYTTYATTEEWERQK